MDREATQDEIAHQIETLGWANDGSITIDLSGSYLTPEEISLLIEEELEGQELVWESKGNGLYEISLDDYF